MSKGNDVENMNDDNLIEELKKLDEDRATDKHEKIDKLMSELDLTNKRPTEMKHNTRVHPPSEVTKHLKLQYNYKHHFFDQHV